MELFFQQLSSIPLAGGGFSDAAIAEGLAEALKMFSKGKQNQNMDGQRHCILVAASNPYPLPTLVYRPQPEHIDQSDNAETPSQYHLSDAEALAKSFAQCSISLSVICPKKLPKLKAIYHAGKSNSQVADLPGGSNDKNPHFLVLISDNFMEARVALSRSGMLNLPSNQNPVEIEVTPVVPAPTISEPSLDSVSPGMSQPMQPGMQPVGMSGNSSLTNMAINQQTSNAMQAGIPQYVKVWEGKLSGRRQGRLVFIADLEGYRDASVSDTLGSNWPQTMEMVKLLSQGYVRKMQYARKPDYIYFRAMNQPLLFCYLQEEKRCGVIPLPSQLLVLSVSDKPHLLLGMLFPLDMLRAISGTSSSTAAAAANPPTDAAANSSADASATTSADAAATPAQQMQQQQPRVQMQQQPAHVELQQQQQQIPRLQQQPQQQKVGTTTDQTCMQGAGRSQVLPRGQGSSQGAPNMPGVTFMG